MNAHKDAANYKKVMEPFLSGEVDSADNPQYAMRRIVQHEKILSVSYNLRDAAEAVYNHSTHSNDLAMAMEWARLANEWFPHFSNAAVYAGLLFKTGMHQKAIEMMEKASRDSFLEQTSDTKKLLLENVETMKQGKLPVGLWKVEIPETVVAK